MICLLDKPTSDVLNAAQSGGLAQNLDHELDYLIAGNYRCKSFGQFIDTDVCVEI
jgi:hypothetical protein